MRIDKAKARELAHASSPCWGWRARQRLLQARGAAERVAVARSLVLERRCCCRRAAVESRREVAPPRAAGDPRVATIARADGHLRPHDQEEASPSPTLIVMRAGGSPRGPPQELYEAPASRFLAVHRRRHLVDGELAVGAGGATFTAGGASAAVRADGVSRVGHARGSAHRCASSRRGRTCSPALQACRLLGSRIEMWWRPRGRALVFDAKAFAARTRRTVGVSSIRRRDRAAA